MKNLIYIFVDRETFFPILNELRPKVFSENNDIDYISYWSDDEKEKFKILQTKYRTEVRSYLLCKDGDKVVGWSWGYQKDGEEFSMVNSGVLPEYRGKGIYHKLLSMMVEKAKDDGFQVISSTHHASNNPILIPKLKFGFKIVGFKLNVRFGTLIDLHYYTNEKMNKAMDYRTGFSKTI